MILYVDQDAFYASVEERDRPELVGKPVIVGGTPEKRGVVSAANYVARRYGIHSAMPAVTARRLCPQGVFLPPRIGYYAEVSGQIREIFQRFTPLVEPLSLDEAFLDVTGSEHLFGPAVEIGRQIKQAIREELRLVASVGVAPNKFLAKIASDLKKPDALVVVEPDKVQAFLDSLPVERLWGVGKQSSKVFPAVPPKLAGKRHCGVGPLEGWEGGQRPTTRTQPPQLPFAVSPGIEWAAWATYRRNRLPRRAIAMTFPKRVSDCCWWRRCWLSSRPA